MKQKKNPHDKPPALLFLEGNADEKEVSQRRLVVPETASNLTEQIQEAPPSKPPNSPQNERFLHKMFDTLKLKLLEDIR